MRRAAIAILALALTAWPLGSDFAPHNMTANNSPVPYVASASSEFSASFEAYKAFDGLDLLGNYWVSTDPVAWLQMDIGAGNTKVLGAYAIHINPFSEQARAPKDWTMEGSNDGSSWTTLDTVTDETGWVNEETRTFVCDVVGGAYRYFRLNITANNGDSLTSVAEFYMYEAAAPRYRSYSM